MRKRKTIWAAIAQYSGRDAGHVCYGHTKDEARAKARLQTTMSVVVRRELVSISQVRALKAIGKI